MEIFYLALVMTMYTVGWICSIRTEYVAAQEFLDEEHGIPQSVDVHDNNIYALGRMRDHNVVIVLLTDGKDRTSSAAAVARDMLHSFPNIRIGLTVGVASGAPSQQHDIRLGDIVVSSPGNGKGGVFQSDFGKQIQDRDFEMTGFLNQPPTLLRNAVNGLRADIEAKGHRFEQAIDDIISRNQRLQKKFQRPGPDADKLFRSDIVHSSLCTDSCTDDPSLLIPRAERTEEDDNPAVHYGLICSGNQLIDDATTRDRFATERNVLCFKMEAAGLMNHFPCLVICGICDYADTHQNDEWQGFAAMTAASYAKSLLLIIPLTKAERSHIRGG
ncbi:purine and uridine phosphorylase [Aspergillus steynii IBT 23096]|uniref:Purine and uridine phosphorylase n=1 Tax=Aspergillus steynii IBT 23096 TaxID=1392250 RepID=A0A2I2FYV0_9EURO|nr:purine and uridine phosphorylase [Aspergillus steynii IBT 23096]PLB45812.1 purine and uridine phosphorylase [Aspergillus steynii IBT 23096]